MVGIFRSNNPLNTSILFVYGLLLKLGWFLHYPLVSRHPSDGFLFTAIADYLQQGFQSWKILAPSIIYLLLFSQAIMLGYLVNSRKMLPRVNYLAAMAYLLITSFFPQWNTFSSVLFVNSVLIWIMLKITNVNSVSGIKGGLFNIGLAIGICSFFYLPSLFFAIIVLIGVVLMRPPRFAELGMIFFGMLASWYFLFAGVFLLNKLYLLDLKKLRLELPVFRLTPEEITGIVLLAVSMLIGIYYVQSQAAKQVVQVRKRWSFLLISLVLLVFIPVLQPNPDLRNWLLCLAPFSLLLGAAFYYMPVKWIRALLNWAMVAFVLYLQYAK